MNPRRASFAGSFYSDNAAELSSQIDSFLKEAGGRTVDEKIIALVSPHAGYIYSGPVAAHAFAQVAGEHFDSVIVLAPSHRARFNGFCVRPSGSYMTPLGDIPIDEKIASALSVTPLAIFNDQVDSLEHSLEVQLPFLQKTIGEFSLVPIIVGTADLSHCRQIAQDIYSAMKGTSGKMLVVISTDLSHYHSYEQAKKMDAAFSSVLQRFDEKLLSECLDRDEAEACGEGPLLVGISLSKLLGAACCRVLHCANSGDTAGDRSRVVGYLSAAFTG
jgi:AmmeMemoRadiSam system protein B